MKIIYASIFALLIPSTVNAQIVQDSFFGDNVIQSNNYYNRPARVVKKVVRSAGKNVYNTYNIYNDNTTTVAPPATVVTPPPTVTVVQPPPVTVVQPAPVVTYYPPPAPVPVYGGYYGY